MFLIIYIYMDSIIEEYKSKNEEIQLYLEDLKTIIVKMHEKNNKSLS